MEELDLKELFTMFWNRKLGILLIVFITVVCGVIYSYFGTTPEYKSTTTLVLVQSTKTMQPSGEGAITQTDLTLNSSLVSTYSEIIASKGVLTQVITNLNIPDLTVEDFGKIKQNVSVEAVKDTEVIKISVKSEEPNRAALVANEIAKVFSEKVVAIYNISNIYILDRAEASGTPYNINHTRDIIIFAFIGFVIAIVFTLVMNMLDTTIKTEEYIENTIGLVVLSSIPDYNIEENKRKGGKRQ